MNVEKAIYAAKTLSKRIPAVTFGRTISQKGNGIQRVVVKGFGNGNLDTYHFRMTAFDNMLNRRPVIKGFTGQEGFAGISGIPGRGRVKFFPNFQTPNMKRHIVYDIQPPRTQVQGFRDLAGESKIASEAPKTPIALPKREDLIAKERVVIQGFGGNNNTASKPIYKPLETDNGTPRTIVKGFRG